MLEGVKPQVTEKKKKEEEEGRGGGGGGGGGRGKEKKKKYCCYNQELFIETILPMSFISTIYVIPVYKCYVIK